MKIILFSPNIKRGQKQLNGGILNWTISYLNNYNNNIHHIDVVNTHLIGKRKTGVVKKISLKDEISRTYTIFKEFLRLTKSCNYDVAHVNSSAGKFGIFREYLIALILKKKKIKLILHFHCNLEDTIGTSRIRRYVFVKLCRLSKNVILLNNYSLEYSLTISKETNKFSVIPNFIEENFIKKSKNIQNDITQVIFVGFIQPSKGCNEIFDLAKTRTDLNFTLVGKLHQGYNKFVLPDNIRIISCEDRNCVMKILDKSDVFLFPSYSEGFSLALLEGMSRGLPIITTDVGANKEMIETSGGKIVSHDIETINQALIEFQDSETRRQISQWNINKVQSKYTVGKVLERIFEIYQE